VELRRVSMDDKEILLKWANDPVTRQNSFDSNTITFPEHEKWFQDKLDNKGEVMLMAVDQGKGVGHIRFCLENGQAEVNINVAPDERGKGYGTALLKIAVPWLLEHHGAQKVIAHIKPDNLPSIKTFQKAGFHICDLERFKGQDCFKMQFHQ